MPDPLKTGIDDDVRRGHAAALRDIAAAHPELVIVHDLPEAPGVQQAVTMAAALAKQGKLPVVGGYGGTLATQASEQVSEATAGGAKVMYVGTQGMRDAGIMRTIVGLTVCEPGSEQEAYLMTRYLLEEHPRSSYMRLADSAGLRELPLPEGHKVRSGRGWVMRMGTKVAFIAAGPVMLAHAMEAAEMLKLEERMEVKVIDLPWHTDIDLAWLTDVLNDAKFAIVLDDHVMRGAQSEELRRIFKYDARFTGIVGRHISLDGFAGTEEPLGAPPRVAINARSITDKTVTLVKG